MRCDWSAHSSSEFGHHEGVTARRGAQNLERELVDRLAAAGCVWPDDEARLVLDRAIDSDHARRLVERRAAGERLEYVLGSTSFASVRIEVGSPVFVPRPQTAILAVRAAELLTLVAEPVALDLFAGTAAIACAIKARVPRARVVAGELDPTSLDYARRNAARFGVEVCASDVDRGVPPELERSVDVLTANVPYVPTAALPVLARESMAEHTASLDGGDDGLRWTGELVACAPRWLRTDGWLLTEVGVDQVEAGSALLRAGRFDVADVIADVHGLPRILVARWPGAPAEA